MTAGNRAVFAFAHAAENRPGLCRPKAMSPYVRDA